MILALLRPLCIILRYDIKIWEIDVMCFLNHSFIFCLIYIYIKSKYVRFLLSTFSVFWYKMKRNYFIIFLFLSASLCILQNSRIGRRKLVQLAVKALRFSLSAAQSALCFFTRTNKWKYYIFHFPNENRTHNRTASKQ